MAAIFCVPSQTCLLISHSQQIKYSIRCSRFSVHDDPSLPSRQSGEPDSAPTHGTLNSSIPLHTLAYRDSLRLRLLFGRFLRAVEQEVQGFLRLDVGGDAA